MGGQTPSGNPKAGKHLPATPHKTRPNRKPDKRLKPSEWIQARIQYETGACNVAAIAKIWDVSESSVEKKCSKEKWTEKKIGAEILKKQQETAVEIFSRLGMKPEDYFQTVLDGITKTETVKVVKKVLTNKSGNVVKKRSGAPVVYDQTVKIEDNYHRFKFCQEYAKLTGLYAAPKQAIESAPEHPEEPIPHVLDLPDANPQDKPKEEASVTGSH